MATKTNPNKIVDTTTKAFEDAVIKTQEQYFAALEQGQAAALEGYSALVDTVGKVDVPAVPGMETIVPQFDAIKIPANVFNGAFDFGVKVLENQREFASKMLAVAAKA